MGKKAFSRFSETERSLAKAWAKQGKAEKDIAELLGRDPGTVNLQGPDSKGTVRVQSGYSPGTVRVTVRVGKN